MQLGKIQIKQVPIEVKYRIESDVFAPSILKSKKPLFIERIFVNESDRNNGFGTKALAIIEKYAVDNFCDCTIVVLPINCYIWFLNRGYFQLNNTNIFYKKL